MSNSDSNSSISSGELLSSFMDGELDHRAASFFARRLSQDDALQSDWARWHMVRDAMRDGDSAVADVDFAARVHSALEAETSPTTVSAKPQWGQRMLKPIASAAIAATVAMTAIIGVNQYRGNDTVPTGVETVPLAANNLDAQSQVTVNSSPSVNLPVVPVSLENGPSRQQDPLARARLEAYLLRHYWQLGADGRASFTGAMPIITGESGVTPQAGDEQASLSTQPDATKNAAGNLVERQPE